MELWDRLDLDTFWHSLIALIITPDGLPIGYEVMRGNPSDKTTLRGMLEKITGRYGKEQRTWIMDRGIPTEAVLQEMRRTDPSVRHLVGTPKGRLTKMEKDLAGKDWQEVKDDVHLKLLPRDGELYVLARSLPRRAKESAMHRKKLKATRCHEGQYSLRSNLTGEDPDARRFHPVHRRTRSSDEALHQAGESPSSATRSTGLHAPIATTTRNQNPVACGGDLSNETTQNQQSRRSNASNSESRITSAATAGCLTRRNTLRRRKTGSRPEPRTHQRRTARKPRMSRSNLNNPNSQTRRMMKNLILKQLWACIARSIA